MTMIFSATLPVQGYQRVNFPVSEDGLVDFVFSAPSPIAYRIPPPPASFSQTFPGGAEMAKPPATLPRKGIRPLSAWEIDLNPLPEPEKNAVAQAHVPFDPLNPEADLVAVWTGEGSEPVAYRIPPPPNPLPPRRRRAPFPDEAQAAETLPAPLSPKANGHISFADVCEVIGPQASVELALRLPGHSLDISRQPRRGSLLVQAVGLEAAEKLGAVYAGGRFQVSVSATKLVMVKVLREKGWSINKIAAELYMSRDAVYANLRKRTPLSLRAESETLPLSEQLDLFP